MSTPFLMTYYDLIDRCQDFLGGNSGTAGVRDIRAAIQDAMREVTHARRWSYLVGRYTITYDADYSTGTVVYDHTGGTYERMLTLTTGTWPNNVARGEVVISSVAYRVEKRVSDSIITLAEDSNPGADVSSTTYLWVRSLYTLPQNFGQLLDLSVTGANLPAYTTPDDILYQQNQSVGVISTAPYLYTLRGDRLTGAMGLEVFPYPDTAGLLNLTYKKRMRPLKIDGKNTSLHSAGTATCTAGSKAVSGSGTAWTAAMEGSVIRFGSDTTTIPTELGGVAPYAEEGIIHNVTSNTALTLAEFAGVSVAAKKYVVSDPVDMDQSMLNCLLRCIEWQIALRRRSKDVDQLESNYKKSLYQAAEADNVMGGMRVVGDGLGRGWDPSLLQQNEP